jgi:hypothetical protein
VYNIFSLSITKRNQYLLKIRYVKEQKNITFAGDSKKKPGDKISFETKPDYFSIGQKNIDILIIDALVGITKILD